MMTHMFSRLAQLLAKKQRQVYWLPIVLLMVAFGCKILSPAHYARWIQEDGVLESIQLLCFLLTTYMSIRVSLHLLSMTRYMAGLLWGLFALACLFISMEEISWGQRFFEIQPAVDKTVNLQGETNLHNHKHLQIWFLFGYLLIGLVGSVGIKVFRQLHWLLPSPTLLWYFLPVFLFYLHLLIGAGIASDYGIQWLVPARSLLHPQLLLYKDQEVIEVLLGLGFFMHACFVYADLKWRAS
ncbi:hypothetical protein [Methylophilus aquaticus]|uniref:Uncharacterized protein n=1 Tax=Methylophilus aquaticus TaxID=1971610 RepID=A0ABT9JP82_9PROT|nr:hypothetical protein [Methylophilus aquaticus]MDP8566382.1 hypothetical protein [Methylophilus aquaticus]